MNKYLKFFNDIYIDNYSILDSIENNFNIENENTLITNLIKLDYFLRLLYNYYYIKLEVYRRKNGHNEYDNTDEQLKKLYFKHSKELELKFGFYDKETNSTKDLLKIFKIKWTLKQLTSK